MVTSRLILVVLVLGLTLGCDATSTAPEPEIVVESYQIAGAPLGPVRLNRTVGIGGTFSSSGTGVSGATVTVERLDENGQVAARYAYVPDGEERGLYRSESRSVTVVPTATYRLAATIPGEGRVTATTTVPGAFSIVRTENERVVFQGPNQPSITITRSGTTGRQDVFLFTVISLLDFANTPSEDLEAELTPLYADTFDPDEESIQELQVNSSPILNEGNYTRNPDGTITIDLPWLAVAFHGPNRVAVNVLDTNYYDFLRTRQAQQAGRPGEIPNVLDRVEGGTGLFGSFARVTSDVEILRPDVEASR